MKKIFFLLLITFLLNGCFQSVALIGSSVGGASSGRMLQSSLNSAVSYGIKKTTGKTPLGHALAYAEEINPEKKEETCISFIEKTRSEFCTALKKQISLTNDAMKKKLTTIKKESNETTTPLVAKVALKPQDKIDFKIAAKPQDKINLKIATKPKIKLYVEDKKSPRELAIAFQTDMKNKSKNKNLNLYLSRR